MSELHLESSLCRKCIVVEEKIIARLSHLLRQEQGRGMGCRGRVGRWWRVGEGGEVVEEYLETEGEEGGRRRGVMKVMVASLDSFKSVSRFLFRFLFHIFPL